MREVYDLSGRGVDSFPMESEGTVTFGRVFPPGIYTLHVGDGRHSHTQKVRNSQR